MKFKEDLDLSWVGTNWGKSLEKKAEYYSNTPRTFFEFLGKFEKLSRDRCRPFDEIDNNFNVYKFPNKCLGKDTVSYNEYMDLIKQQLRLMREFRWNVPRYNENLIEPQVSYFVEKNLLNPRLLKRWDDDYILKALQLLARKRNQNWDHLYIQQSNKAHTDIIMEAVNNEYKFARIMFQDKVEVQVYTELWLNKFKFLTDVTINVFYDIGNFIHFFMGMFGF